MYTKIKQTIGVCNKVHVLKMFCEVFTIQSLLINVVIQL